MGSMWDDICEFHQKFKIPQTEVPGIHNDEMIQFRMNFLKEELQEFEDALACNDTTMAFDALIDLVYVAMGTAYICNFPFDEGWEHVHTANMMKERVKQKSASKRLTTYDIVKPEGWVAPDKMLTVLLLQRQHQLEMAKFVTSRPIEDEDALHEDATRH